MKLTNKQYTNGLINHKATFGILDFNKFIQEDTEVLATLNHYPAHLDRYVKLSGPIYYERNINGESSGIHGISTLPGSSGAGLIVDNMVAGVHVSGGKSAHMTRVFFDASSGTTAFGDGNTFELISLDEIKEAGEQAEKRNDIILLKLIKEYIGVCKMSLPLMNY